MYVYCQQLFDTGIQYTRQERGEKLHSLVDIKKTRHEFLNSVHNKIPAYMILEKQTKSMFDYFRTHPSCPAALHLHSRLFLANEQSMRTKSRAGSLANIISPQVFGKAKNTWSQCGKSPAPNSRVNKILILGRGQVAVSFDGNSVRECVIFKKHKGR